MLAPNEIEYLTQLEDNGTELQADSKLAMAKYDESLNEVFELCDQYFGDDGELN